MHQPGHTGGSNQYGNIKGQGGGLEYEQQYTSNNPNYNPANPNLGYLTFGQAQGLGSADLLSGFGISSDDPMDLAMVQGFGEQYGWKTDQMKQNMYQGVGSAMSQAGTSLGQMREQSRSLASQTGLRRGRGSGVQEENIYDQYTQGLTGMQTKTQQGIESLRHEWYDDLTSTMAGIKARQEA
jgi:hypothetical protein